MITSTQNPKMKHIRSLQSSSRARREAGVFVIEGVRLVEEALRAGWRARQAFYTSDLSDRGERLVRRFADSGSHIELVAPHVMRSISDTQTPQGILAVVENQELRLPEKLDFALILDEVRDPGNLGTILRSACAAGTQAVLIPPGSVDPYAPKVLRAAMGAHFRLPVITCSWEQLGTIVKASPLNIFLADVNRGEVYSNVDFNQPLALVLGGEAEGAGAEVRNLVDEYVRIPMPGGSESLNVAVAAGVLLFEVVRQRDGI